MEIPYQTNWGEAAKREKILLKTNSSCMPESPDKPFINIEDPSAITAANVREFYDYWRSCAQGKDIPGWPDIDLMSIYHLSPRIVVKDVVDDGCDFRNRFWGTEIALIHDFDATSRCYNDYLQLKSAREEQELHRAIRDSRTPVKISGSMETWRKKDHIRFEGVICPLTDKTDAVDILIACYNFNLADL